MKFVETALHEKRTGKKEKEESFFENARIITDCIISFFQKFVKETVDEPGAMC